MCIIWPLLCPVMCQAPKDLDLTLSLHCPICITRKTHDEEDPSLFRITSQHSREQLWLSIGFAAPGTSFDTLQQISWLLWKQLI
jgi:hypothetical protein